MAGKIKRQWFVVYKIGSSEYDYFVSAISERAVRKWLGVLGKSHKVLPARSYHLAKAMSGLALSLSAPNEPAPLQWYMVVDGKCFLIAILN